MRAATVRAYKSLAQVERAFRSLKTVDLEIRPILHWLAGRVRAHVFLCMLAYHVEWHMRRKLAPLLFEDHDREAAAARQRPRRSPPPEVSPAARAKAQHPNAPTTACRCTASAPCSPISPRSPATPCASATPCRSPAGPAHPAAATRLRPPRPRPRAVGRADPPSRPTFPSVHQLTYVPTSEEVRSSGPGTSGPSPNLAHRSGPSRNWSRPRSSSAPRAGGSHRLRVGEMSTVAVDLF